MIFIIWKAKPPLKWNVFFLPNVFQLRSRQHRHFVHVSERETFFTEL